MIDLIDYLNEIQRKKRLEPEIMLEELLSSYHRASNIGYERYLEEEREAFEKYARWENELKFLNTHDDLWQAGHYYV